MNGGLMRVGGVYGGLGWTVGHVECKTCHLQFARAPCGHGTCVRRMSYHNATPCA